MELGARNSEPHYLPGRNGDVDHKCQPPAWAPARLARRLFEESAALPRNDVGSGNPAAEGRTPPDAAKGQPLIESIYVFH